jgi:putative transposase
MPKQSTEDLQIMQAIDEIFTRCPFYGSRRIHRDLKDDYGLPICREHVQRLMRLMRIEAIHPKKRTTIPNKDHGVYPYLLRNLPIIRPNQAWGTDITFIRLLGGFCYLVAILDWFSRYVLAWKLSATMETDFCLAALTEALKLAVPEIHNSDQGSQFTSLEYLALLKDHPQIQISMDGRGRCMDNIFTERLWRSVKYEEVYLKNYQALTEAEAGINHYFQFYNTKRKHQSLDYKTPYEVYFG